MKFAVHLKNIDALLELRFHECEPGCDCERNGCVHEATYYVNGKRVYASDAMHLVEIDRAGIREAIEDVRSAVIDCETEIEGLRRDANERKR